MTRLFVQNILKLQKAPVLRVEARADGAIQIVRPGGGVGWGDETNTRTATNEGTETSASTRTSEGTTTGSGTGTNTNGRFVLARAVVRVMSRPLSAVGQPSMVVDQNGFDQLVDSKGEVVRSAAKIDVTSVDVRELRSDPLTDTLVSYTPDPNDPFGSRPLPWPDRGTGGFPGGGVGSAQDDDSDDDSDSDNGGDSDEAGDSDNSRDSDEDEDKLTRGGIVVGFEGTGVTPPLSPDGTRAKRRR